MDQKQYKIWRQATLAALLVIYSLEESNEIMWWFDNIKGSGERDLLGYEKFKAMEELLEGIPEVGFSLHQHMSARVWAYAPHIIKEYREEKNARSKPRTPT